LSISASKRSRISPAGPITAQLIDAITGTDLWADRFDGSLGDLFGFRIRWRRTPWA
jgi:TolB-like protein